MSGFDKNSGLIHSIFTTVTNVNDITPVDKLLHGDAGYHGIAKRPETAGY